MTPIPQMPHPPNSAFPNFIPGKFRLPADFKLWPDAFFPDLQAGSLPVTPPIPPPVATGDVITSVHENTVSTAINDLWINVQWLAANLLSDPTTAKGDLIVNDGTGLEALALGGSGEVLTADPAQPLGLKWAALSPGGVISVFGRSGAVVAAAGDYTAAQVSNAVDATGSYANPAWITSLAWSKITGAPASVPASRQVIAGAGLSGGGSLAADVTLAAVPMGASGSGHAPGIVPDPGATLGATRYLREDATWEIPAGSGGGMTDPTTTQGDIIVRGAAATTRLGVGVNGQILIADSTQPLGVRWGAAAASGVSSVFGRSGAVIATVGDYTAAQITNAVDATGSYANPAWITSLAWSKITGAPAGGSQTPWTSDIDGAGFTLKNVGSTAIGTASPASKLDVEGPQNATGGISIGSGGGADPGVYGYQIYRDAIGLLQIIGNQSGTAGFVFGNATERMRIAASGNVGIANVNPAYALDVTGVIAVGGKPISQITLQNVVTASRAVNGIYQNATGKPMFIVVAGSCPPGGALSAYTGSTSPPGQGTGAQGNTGSSTNTFSVAFWVMPAQYYQVVGNTTLVNWIEWS